MLYSHEEASRFSQEAGEFRPSKVSDGRPGDDTGNIRSGFCDSSSLEIIREAARRAARIAAAVIGRITGSRSPEGSENPGRPHIDPALMDIILSDPEAGTITCPGAGGDPRPSERRDQGHIDPRLLEIILADPDLGTITCPGPGDRRRPERGEHSDHRVSLSNKDREIAQLPLQTETITAANSDITDEGLKLSGRLRYLRNLVVSNTAVTDHGLSEISNLPALEYLDLSSTKISDAGVQSLKNLKNLSIIDLRNTNVTEEGIRELHKALPSCTIYNDVCGDIRPDKIAMWEEPRDPYANANLERVVPYPSHLAGATSIEQFGNIMHEGWLSGKPEDMGKFTRDLIKLRSGMAQLIEEISPILNPEIAEVQSRWPDLSPEQAEAVAVLRLSANDPEFALKYELFSRLSQQYDSKMEPMRQSLQEALDRASASLGMPQVELNFIQGWGASGVYGDGKISVCSPYQLDDFPKLTALIYHEQVHAKQDVDIICLARDRELGDARLSTDQETRKEQLEKVASTYKEMTGHELNLDWATRVITYREQHSDSLQLTPLERERAESLTQPLRDYPETRQGTLEQDFRDVERTLKFRLDDAGVEGILQALANHETKTQLSLILFGSENPPPEIQAAVDYFSRHHENFDALSLVQTKTALRRLLIERLHRINQERRQNSEDYFFNPFEAEAQIVGRLAERIYQQRFSRPEDAKDVV